MPSYSGKRNHKSFNPGTTYAINNNSEMKAEAWEFIKLLLSDEIQSGDEMYKFPVNLNTLKKREVQDLADDYIIYNSYREQGRNIKPLTQADVDMVNKMIGELRTIPYSDAQADEIVYDGVKEFFSGKKTAEEAAKLIQNKMNIYLGE